MLRGKCMLVFEFDVEVEVDRPPTLAVIDADMRVENFHDGAEMRVAGRLAERVWHDGRSWCAAKGEDGPLFHYGEHLTLVRW